MNLHDFKRLILLPFVLIVLLLVTSPLTGCATIKQGASDFGGYIVDKICTPDNE